MPAPVIFASRLLVNSSAFVLLLFFGKAALQRLSLFKKVQITSDE